MENHLKILQILITTEDYIIGVQNVITRGNTILSKYRTNAIVNKSMRNKNISGQCSSVSRKTIKESSGVDRNSNCFKIRLSEEWCIY